MREIQQYELGNISGGVDCVSFETWQNIQSKARKDGFTFGTVATVLVGAAVSPISLPLAAGAAAVTFPVASWTGFHYSPAWKVFS